MQSRGLEVVVGLFICLGIAAAFVLTMRVSNLSAVSGNSGYSVTASFTNIGGLKVGAPVNLAGVRIGRVSGIKIDPDTYDAVVAMQIKNQYKIPKDSGASILTEGLLGGQYIGVSPGVSDTYIKNNGKFTITQPAVILEKLIGQFMSQMSQ